MPRTPLALPLASMLLLLAACGDDTPAGEGGGGSGATSTTSAGSGTTSSTTAATTSGAGGGDGGAGGVGGGGGEGGEGGAGGQGGGDGGGSCEAPKPFELADTEAACDELAAELEPGAFHVEWLDVPRDEVFVFENEIAADYAWPYVITFPEEYAEDMELLHTRCYQLAGQEETCTEGLVEPMPTGGACTQLFSPRFGLDPTSYAEGENHYRVGFTLNRRGCAQVTTEFGFTVVYAPPVQP